MPAKGPFANAVFFPAAALQAALVLPWSVLALQGLIPAPPGLSTPAGHAHEMLFGFALAVVAGYLLGPQPKRWLAAVFGCWLIARLAFWFAPGAWPTFVVSGIFAALVAARVVPRFAGAAKKWRNQTVAPVVLGLAVCAAAGSKLVGSATGPALLVLHETVLLLAVLLFFMGGRIIAPALAGHIVKHRGESMPHRVQPTLEGSVLILMGAALLLAPWWNLPARQLTGACLLLAGMLVGVRWIRWRPWTSFNRPDLLALLIGYLWLVPGLILMGLARLIEAVPVTTAVHAITAGALGTLTLTVMMRTRLLYRFRDANHFALAHVATGLVQIAALSRVVPPLAGLDGYWLIIASGFWAFAFGIGFVVLIRTLK